MRYTKESTKTHTTAPWQGKLKETNESETFLVSKMHINYGKIQTARPIPNLFEILGSILLKKKLTKISN